MGFIANLLTEKEQSLEEEVRQDPLSHHDERFIGLEDVGASPQRIQQYLSAGGFDVAVDNVHDRRLNSTGKNKLHPFLVSEAAAIDESLRVQEPRRDFLSEGDVADLGIRVFQDVVEEVEPRLEEFDSEDDSDFSSELDHTGERNYVMSAVAPDETASFRYVHENCSWKPMDEVEGSGPVRGIEMYMKRKPYGKKRWRVRETDLVKPDGEWKARYSWSEDPTPETEEVHQMITEVVDIYRKEFPSLEYTLFGSGCGGRMTEGSDIEHSIVINVEDLGLDDNKEVHDDPKVRAKLRHLRKQITSDIILSINEDLDISMGYGYSATRDEGTEYGFNRKSHSGQDSRIVFREEGSELVEEYDEYLETNGLIRRHPTRK
jgi:hypothetical protein